MNFKALLDFLRADSLIQQEKGARFEKLIKNWFLKNPIYKEVKSVWLWRDFPAKSDCGIALETLKGQQPPVTHITFEHFPSYIFDLLLSVINVSLQTLDIADGLPRLEFEEKP